MFSIKKPGVGKRSVYGPLGAGLFSLCAVIFTTDVLAQYAELEEVVVTARKREESLQEAPVAVSVFSADRLDERNVSSTLGLTAFVPNLSGNTGLSGGSHANYYIRGVGQTDHIASVDAGVSIYVDGVYMGRANGADIATMDLERVEVLRGPQGTLFGKNTLGGAINVITAKPAQEYAGSASLIVGDRDWLEARGWLNIPLSENVAARFSVNARTQDGYGESVISGTTFGSDETYNGRARMLWTPNDNFELDVMADVLSSRGTANLVTWAGSGVLGFFGPAYDQANLLSDPYETNGTHNPGDDIEIFGGSVGATWNLTENLTLKSISAYRTLQQVTGTDFDGSELFLIDQTQATDQNQFSQELQLSGVSPDGRINWLLGGFYFDESVDQAVALNIFSLPLNQVSFIDIENTAIFGQVTFAVSDTFSITAGARYTREEKDHSVNNYFVTSQAQLFPDDPDELIHVPVAQRGVETFPFTPNQASWNSFDPKVSFEWQASGETLFYFSYAEGFKSGGFNGRPSSAADFLSYNPEELASYEIGIKSDLLDNRLRLNVAAFFNQFDGLQLLGLENLIVFTQNAGEAETYGLEVESTAVLSESWLLDVNVGYLNAEYVSLDPGVTIVALDHELPQSPEWTVNVGLQNELSLGGGGSLTSRVDYSYRSSHVLFANGNPGNFQGGYPLVNARFTFAPGEGNWKVALFATNLTDELYYDQREDVTDSFDLSLDWPGAPRTVGLQLSYDF